MTAITYQPVSNVDFDDFTAAFNLAYSDYYVNIFMTSDSFRALMQRDDLVQGSSVAALDGDQIVGMGLLGVRASTGWIGGLGVIPGYRRQGIGRHMMHALIERAREHQLERVKLEVIEANTKAYALYHQLGFTDIRYLHYIQREPGSSSKSPKSFQIERQNPEILLEYFDAFHDTENPWQRGYPSLNKLAAHMRGWAVLENDEIIGYALGWSDHNQIRISDIATRPNTQRAEIAHALLAHLHQLYPDAHAMSINVADDDPALDGYQDMGYTTHLRQHEMCLTL